MHEGTGEFGHYYSFIKDGNQWFKFNDFHVTKVTELEVFSSAYGGSNSNTSAYCIFYVRSGLQDNIYPEHKKMVNNLKGKYVKFLPQDLFNFVVKENQNYVVSLMKWQVESIMSNYSRAVENMREENRKNRLAINDERSLVHNSKKKEPFKPPLNTLTSFGDYLIQKNLYSPAVR